MIAKTRFCVKYGIKYLGSGKHMVGWNQGATKSTVLLHLLWASSNSFPSPFSVSPHRWMWPLSNQPCVLPKRKSQDMLVRMVGIFLASVGGNKQRACWCHRLRATNNKLSQNEIPIKYFRTHFTLQVLAVSFQAYSLPSGPVKMRLLNCLWVKLYEVSRK